MNTNDKQDDRFDPLAVALRKEAAQLKTPPVSTQLRGRIIGHLEDPLPAERRPLAMPLLATLAAAALLAVLILPLMSSQTAPVTEAQPIAGEQHDSAPAQAIDALQQLELPGWHVDMDLASIDPSSQLESEASAVSKDLARLGGFVSRILPSNPSPLELL